MFADDVILYAEILKNSHTCKKTVRANKKIQQDCKV